MLLLRILFSFWSFFRFSCTLFETVFFLLRLLLNLSYFDFSLSITNKRLSICLKIAPSNRVARHGFSVFFDAVLYSIFNYLLLRFLSVTAGRASWGRLSYN